MVVKAYSHWRYTLIQLYCPHLLFLLFFLPSFLSPLNYSYSCSSRLQAVAMSYTLHPPPHLLPRRQLLTLLLSHVLCCAPKSLHFLFHLLLVPPQCHPLPFSSFIFIVVSMAFLESEFQKYKHNWPFDVIKLFSFLDPSLPTALRKVATATFLSVSMLL